MCGSWADVGWSWHGCGRVMSKCVWVLGRDGRLRVAGSSRRLPSTVKPIRWKPSDSQRALRRQGGIVITLLSICHSVFITDPTETATVPYGFDAHFRPIIRSRLPAEVAGSIRDPGGPARRDIFQLSIERLKGQFPFAKLDPFCRLRWVWTRTAALPSARDRIQSPFTSPLKATCVPT